ncbi:MAG: glycoside hydrolase family 3 N-terminal domain-containing protein, partial [Clostridia bacterium]
MKEIEELLSILTVEQKARLLSGDGSWHTARITDIPQIMMTDGPHGLRKQKEEDVADINKSYVATCFPTACATASSWNPDLLTEMSKCIGQEALHEKVSIVLGPGVNIKRNPLCGRNFEYFSEDPFLAGRMAS